MLVIVRLPVKPNEADSGEDVADKEAGDAGIQGRDIAVEGEGNG